MNFTQEQLDIINSKEHSFKINAVAGSGKTTTLLEYAKQHPTLKILYLAYNKSLQTALEGKLKEKQIFNMEIKTIHSLAFTKIEAWKYKLSHDLKIQTVQDCVKEVEKERAFYEPTPNYLALVKDLVNFYCNSSIIALDSKLIQNYKKYSSLDAKLLELLKKYEEKILSHIKFILSAMKNQKIEATHDFYLKLFYLNKSISSKLNYDLILVDEAQDISDVMIAIIESQKCKRVYVGDNFQQIYSFRYAINALDKIQLPRYNLTQSFRFGDNFAFKLKNDLNVLYGKKDLKKIEIQGLEKHTNIGKKHLDESKPFCVISRSSFGLVKEVVKYVREKRRKIYFEGGYGSYSFMNQTVYSIFYLKEKKHEKISLDEIKEFTSIEELEEYSKDTKNQDYLNVIKFIKTYGDNIFEINKQIKEYLTTNKEEADIIFTTTHKSKGMEYEQVLMCEDDFISNKDISNPKNKLNNIRINEELNIYYVAATRAKNCISLASLDLSYVYDETKAQENTISTSKFNKKRIPNKKLKNLQEEWLKNNRIKQF